jgi:hypothetical protein
MERLGCVPRIKRRATGNRDLKTADTILRQTPRPVVERRHVTKISHPPCQGSAHTTARPATGAGQSRHQSSAGLASADEPVGPRAKGIPIRHDSAVEVLQLAGSGSGRPRTARTAEPAPVVASRAMAKLSSTVAQSLAWAHRSAAARSLPSSVISLSTWSWTSVGHLPVASPRRNVVSPSETPLHAALTSLSLRLLLGSDALANARCLAFPASARAAYSAAASFMLQRVSTVGVGLGVGVGVGVAVAVAVTVRGAGIEATSWAPPVTPQPARAIAKSGTNRSSECFMGSRSWCHARLSGSGGFSTVARCVFHAMR